MLTKIKKHFALNELNTRFMRKDISYAMYLDLVAAL